MAITYSITTGRIDRKDYLEVERLAENFFHTKEDKEQLPGSEITYEFITQKFPYSVNIIKDDSNVIGHTFALPCDKANRDAFLQGKINERELFYRIKDSIKSKDYTSLYLASAQIRTKYQRKGITSRGFAIHIKEYQKAIKPNLDLFYWSMTPEGQKLAQKVAELAGLPINERE